MRTTLVSLVVLTTLVAACGPHDSPVLADASAAQTQSAPAAAGYVSHVIECTVDLRYRTTRCQTASASPSASTGARAAILVRQCEVVCVEAGVPVYNSSRGWWMVDVGLRNVSRQQMGTADGVRPAGFKTSLILLDRPHAVVGTGTISVGLPNTRISAHGLPRNTLYSSFAGILRPGERTPPRQWGFRVPPGVTRFAYRVVVVSHVEPRILIMEVMPGQRTPQGTVTAGAMVELRNVGWASVTSPTLVLVDSVVGGRTTAVSVPVPGEWLPGERRIVAAADLERVLVPALAGRFPARHLFNNTQQHRLRLMSGGRAGRLLSEAVLVENTVALGGGSFERSWMETEVTSTRILYPDWTSVPTLAPTRCAGQPGCPVLRGTPGF